MPIHERGYSAAASASGRPSAAKRRRVPRPRRLAVEILEDRRMLASGSPPELPGLHLVDPNLDNLRGQVIFDGANDVTYAGPVVINGIEVPPPNAPAELHRQQQEIISDVIPSCDVLRRHGGASSLPHNQQAKLRTPQATSNELVFVPFAPSRGWSASRLVVKGAGEIEKLIRYLALPPFSGYCSYTRCSPNSPFLV